MSQQPDSQDPNDEGLDSLLTHRQTITDTPVEDAEHAPQDTGQPSPAGASSLSRIAARSQLNSWWASLAVVGYFAYAVELGTIGTVYGLATQSV